MTSVSGVRAGFPCPPPSRGEVRQAVEARLSPARAAHSRRVAEEAEQLALRHGVDAEAAFLAGWLHDWCREEPESALVREARALGVPLPADPAQLVPATLHGPVAARLLPLRWPGLPQAVLTAVDRHTTGDPRMTALDCVVFLADLLEPAHDFPGVEPLRLAARTDLRGACAQALTQGLVHLLGAGRRVDPRAVAARNALVAAAAAPPAAGRTGG